jgi:hypothetical protein
MTSTGSSDPLRKPTAREYYPWWLDNLADDVTGEGAAMQGVLQGAENVRRLVLDARALYEHQEFEFTGDYGANGFIEEYTCRIQGEPTSVVVTVKRNTDAKALTSGLPIFLGNRSAEHRVNRDRHCSSPLASGPLDCLGRCFLRRSERSPCHDRIRSGSTAGVGRRAASETDTGDSDAPSSQEAVDRMGASIGQGRAAAYCVTTSTFQLASSPTQPHGVGCSAILF